jgi:NADP-dependent 3-hydroxy acid dehydrogenase YdfG
MSAITVVTGAGGSMGHAVARVLAAMAHQTPPG